MKDLGGQCTSILQGSIPTVGLVLIPTGWLKRHTCIATKKTQKKNNRWQIDLTSLSLIIPYPSINFGL